MAELSPLHSYNAVHIFFKKSQNILHFTNKTPEDNHFPHRFYFLDGKADAQEAFDFLKNAPAEHSSPQRHWVALLIFSRAL